MKKILATAALAFTLFSPTTFAADAPATNAATSSNNEDIKIAVKDFVEYKSTTYGYTIKCPFQPAAVTDLKFDEPAEKGEMLVFLNDGPEVVLGYRINLDAFPEQNAPDFNKDDQKTLDSYIEYLKSVNALDTAMITNIGKDNKGVFMVTAKEITTDEGETITADSQIAMLIFRTKNGDRVSMQLLTQDFSQELIDAFIYSASTLNVSK